MTPSPNRITAIAVAFELGVLVVALIVGWAVARPLAPLLRPTAVDSFLALPATIPLLVVLWAVVRSRWPPFRRLVAEVDAHVAPLFAECSGLQLVLIALAAGIGEEALFRGGLLLAVDPVGWPLALIATSALFGLVHLVTPAYAALAGVVGLYLGALALWSGGVWLPAAVHALYDSFALAVLVRLQSPARRTTGPPSPREPTPPRPADTSGT